MQQEIQGEEKKKKGKIKKKVKSAEVKKWRRQCKVGRRERPTVCTHCVRAHMRERIRVADWSVGSSVVTSPDPGWISALLYSVVSVMLSASLSRPVPTVTSSCCVSFTLKKEMVQFVAGCVDRLMKQIPDSPSVCLISVIWLVPKPRENADRQARNQSATLSHGAH